MLGVIGGTGLYALPGLEGVKENFEETPFGAPSGPVVQGTLNGKGILFLARHGANHKLLPSEVNYRANIFALKKLGAKSLLSISAVGSLCQEMAPGDLVAVDQYLDFTKGQRRNSFFGEGVVAHIQGAYPVSPLLHANILAAGDKLSFLNRKLHGGGTYVCVEGPRLGSRAESLMFQGLGAHVVGMTNVPEAFLAREAQLAYASLGVVTDYDSWQDDPKLHVEVARIFELYSQSLGDVLKIIQETHSMYSSSHMETCMSRKALAGALLSRPEYLPDQARAWLEVLQR